MINICVNTRAAIHCYLLPAICKAIRIPCSHDTICVGGPYCILAPTRAQGVTMSARSFVRLFVHLVQVCFEQSFFIYLDQRSLRALREQSE